VLLFSSFSRLPCSSPSLRLPLSPSLPLSLSLSFSLPLSPKSTKHVRARRLEKSSFLATWTKTRRVPTRTTSPRSLSAALPPPATVEKIYPHQYIRRFLLPLLLPLLLLLHRHHHHHHHHNNHHHHHHHREITDAGDAGCILDFAVAGDAILGEWSIPSRDAEDLSRPN